MQHTNKLRLVLLFLILTVSGCVSRPSTMLASTSPIPAGIRGTIKTAGSNCQYFLLGLIPLSTSASSAEALENAKNYADVDVLTDVTQDYGGGYYILWSTSCIRISGMGVPREMLR